VVSLHDPDARPIAKGRINRPVEFGYKAQVVDNEDGIVLDYTVEEGNPPDAPELVPAVKRITERAGRVPAAVTTDRGYGEARVEAELRGIGVKTVAIPRKGQPGLARRATEHSRRFRSLIKWRTGCEGRISHLKHRYGWARKRRRRPRPHCRLVRTRSIRAQPGEGHRTGGRMNQILAPNGCYHSHPAPRSTARGTDEGTSSGQSS
jgi:IS5 family transposase